MQHRWGFSQAENHFDDLADAPLESTTISLRPTDENTGRLVDFPALEEITVQEPTIEQMAVIASLSSLKRLRIGHARFTDFAKLPSLRNLEELALIWMRGVPDFAALNDLPHLRSLFLENVNDLADFSTLSGLNALTTLEIAGKLGKPQKLDNLAFLAGLRGLRNLRLGDFTCRTKSPVCAPLLHLTALRELSVTSGCLAPDDWALLETHFPFIEGRGEPLVFVQPAGNHRWIEGIHDATAADGLPDGDYLVTFGLKGFGAFWGPKAEGLKKIRGFEARLMSARSKAAAD